MWLVAPVLCLVSLAARADALVQGFHLKPASATVKTGGTVKLKLVYCFVVDDKAEGAQKGRSGDKPKKKNADDDLAPVAYLVCEGDVGYEVYAGGLTPLVFPVDVKWKVDGQGRVSGDKESATYHAPPSKPTPNKATVAATLTYNVGKEKTILLSSIAIFDEVKAYTGTFTMYDVTVNSEYTTSLTGNIRWEFDDYYEEGAWREYTGGGTAALRVNRKGCGTHAEFSNVPVEGRLKVFDDKKYEFLINLVGEAEQTRKCRHEDARWEETFSSGGHAMNQGDPCGLKEFYPPYSDVTDLSLNRQGGCAHNVRNQYQERWSFKAVE